MTREELAEKVNELLIERATSETKTALHEKAMSLIDLYAESREIPPPPLKWVSIGEDDFEAKAPFGYLFTVTLDADGKWWILRLNHGRIGGKRTKEETFEFCWSCWKGIWEKEMGQAI